MKLFTNINAFNSSSLGVDFVAYSPTDNDWNVNNTPCYYDTSLTSTTQDYRCQKYDDHVHSQQYDNTFTQTDHYGLYEWVCGDGTVVTCPSGDCADDCRIFRGFSPAGTMAQGDGGVLTIRNVTFA